MMNTAHDAGSETLVFGGIERSNHGNESVDLREVESYSLGLCGDILNSFTAVDSDNLILIGVFEYFE